MADTPSNPVPLASRSPPGWAIQLRKEIMGTDAPRTGDLGSSFCGTTRALYAKYVGLDWLQQSGGDYRIDYKRVEEVCIYQQFYKRRFWSVKTLIRLLQYVILHLYCILLDGGKLEGVTAPAMKELVSSVYELQTDYNGQLYLPTLRPVPRSTLHTKIQWLLDRMIGDGLRTVWFVERDSTQPNEFLQYYMKLVKNTSNFPKRWFGWHNLQFPEHYEYAAVAEREDLGDFTLILEH